jgi:hypothetical protein
VIIEHNKELRHGSVSEILSNYILVYPIAILVAVPALARRVHSHAPVYFLNHRRV